MVPDLTICGLVEASGPGSRACAMDRFLLYSVRAGRKLLNWLGAPTLSNSQGSPHSLLSRALWFFWVFSRLPTRARFVPQAPHPVPRAARLTEIKVSNSRRPGGFHTSSSRPLAQPCACNRLRRRCGFFFFFSSPLFRFFLFLFAILSP